jgi:integrase
MSDMPRPRPPHLHHQISRHGKPVWYVRIGKGKRIRIRAVYGSPEFLAEYDAAIRGERPNKSGMRAAPHTLQWLWDSYRQSEAWLHHSPATRRQRELIMTTILKESSAAPFAEIAKRHILAGLDRRSQTPGAGHNFLKTLRGLFSWAAEREHIKIDPTLGVKYPKLRKGRGHEPWTREDIAAYQKRWPLGTPQRVWVDVLLYTGLRRGDACRVGRQHVRDGILTLRNEKGGETVTVTLPILPILQRTLDAGPTGDLAWICGDRGTPLVKESFGNAFSAAAREAGVKKSAHGVRKIAATIAAENGATVPELEAIFGWSGGRMASLYTREANRVKLAAKAMGKLDETRTSIPSPMVKVRAPARKDNQKQH